MISSGGRLNKVDLEYKQKSVELNRISPEYEAYKTAYDVNSQKLEILKETKTLIKKDIFIK